MRPGTDSSGPIDAPLAADLRHRNDSLDYAPAESWLKLDAAAVDTWVCAALTWVVEPMIALENLIIVAAESQTGKTLLGLYMGLLIAEGGLLFQKFKTSPMKVCYFALEDPVRRIRDRLKDIISNLPADSAPLRNGQFSVVSAPQFDLSHPGLIPHLESLIQKENYAVIFIDTYQRGTPGLTSFDDEEQSVILHRLSALTRKHKIAIIILDHLRKNHSRGKKRVTIADIKGTGGKAQNADGVILMERVGQRLSFSSSSKDFDQVTNIWLAVSREGAPGHKFQFVDYEYVSFQPSASDANCRKVLEAIGDGEMVGRGDLVKRTKLSDSTVHRAIKSLLSAGTIRDNGKKRRWIQYGRVL